MDQVDAGDAVVVARRDVDELVGPGMADQLVDAAATAQGVISSMAAEDGVAIGADQRVVELRAADILDIDQQVAWAWPPKP